MKTHAFALAFLAALPLARAEDVILVSHGRLIEGADTAVSATVAMGVGFYTDALDPNATALWTENYSVQVSSGFYAVEIGSTAGGRKALPDTVLATRPAVFLGVIVDGKALLPRLRFAPAPSALHARKADLADVARALDCAGCLTKDHLAENVLSGLDAATVGGVKPSATPAPNGLLLLDASGRVPAAALPGGTEGGIDAASVNGLSASATPQAGKLLALDSNAQLPLSVIPGGGNATTVGGFPVNATPTPNALLPLDAQAKLPVAALPATLNATQLGGKDPSAFALKSDVPNVALAAGTPSLFDLDGDGRMDATLLPAGFFSNRSINASGQYIRGSSRFVARELLFMKKSPSSVLEITSSHTGGAYMDGTHAGVYFYEMILDNNAVGVGYDHASAGGTGWRMFPRIEREYVEGLSAGIHKLRLDVRGDYNSGLYYAWTGSNMFEVREVPATEKRSTKHFYSAPENTGTSLVAVADRAHSVVTTGGPSVPVLVTLHDSWGAHGTTAGSNTACQWMLYVDGTATGRDATIHLTDDDGWMIFPTTVGWIVENLPANAHYFELRVLKHGKSTNCHNGSGSRGWISVLELDGNRTKYATNLSDTTVTATTWTDIPGRSALAYTKKDAGTATDLRVTYSDNWGYNYASHSWGCRLRLLVDDAEVGNTGEHTETSGGWRLHPSGLTWVLRDIAPGPHNIKLQAMKGDASNCRFGWSGGGIASGAANYFLVEETPRND